MNPIVKLREKPFGAGASLQMNSPAENGTECTNRPTASLLMIAFNFPPVSAAGVHRTLRFAKYLGEFGCRPTVLTRNCSPDPGGDKLLAQVPVEVAIHRIGKSNKRGPDSSVKTLGESMLAPKFRARLVALMKSFLRPGWELVTETPDQYVGWSRRAAAKGIELCRGGGFDAIYTTGPPHSTHLAGRRIHRKTGLPWIADFRDPWARRCWTKERNPWGQRFLPKFEKAVVHAASLVVLNNDVSAEDFQRTYPELPREKFVSIPNGFDPDLVEVVAARTSERRQMEMTISASKDFHVICHPGTLYGQRNPRPILKAIEMLHRKGMKIRFQQIGIFAPEFDPERIGEELGIQHLVEAIPLLSHQEVLKRMSLADALVAIQPNGRLMVPAKLYEMLLFDLPIIAVCDSEATSRVVETAGQAWSVISNDVNGIGRAFEEALFSTKPSNYGELRRKVRLEYDGRNLVRCFHEKIVSILKCPPKITR